MAILLIEDLPWTWAIPAQFLGWNAEELHESMFNHYGVRCPTINSLQKPTERWERELDILLARRLRKVPSLFDQEKGAVVVSDGRGTEKKF